MAEDGRQRRTLHEAFQDAARVDAPMRPWWFALLALLVPSASAFMVVHPIDPQATLDSLVPEPASVPVPEGMPVPIYPACIYGSETGRMCSGDYVETEPYELEVPDLEGGEQDGEAAAAAEEPPQAQPAPDDEPPASLPAQPTEPADGPAAAVLEASAPVPEAPPSRLPSPHAADPAPAMQRQARLAPEAGGLLQALLSSVALALPGALALKGAWAWFLLRRQQRQTCRAAVLDAIGSHPGLRHTELVRIVGRGNGTVEHHVQRLAEDGLVSRVRQAGATCYFPAGAEQAQDARLHLALAGRTSREVALELARSPGLRLSDLAQRIGLRVSSAHYQVAKLEQAGALVRECSSGGSLKLSPAAERWLAGTPSAPSRAGASVSGLHAPVGGTA
jgi:DNA-binding MarR family transcriptional regulator